MSDINKLFMLLISYNFIFLYFLGAIICNNIINKLKVFGRGYRFPHVKTFVNLYIEWFYPN